jgi:MoaA/NifB/PqqE/SkfB family radical SAM enzyme
MDKSVRGCSNKFNFFDELGDFLENVPLTDKTAVRFCGGELSLKVDDVIYAYNKFKKYEKYIDARFSFSLVTNGYDLNSIVELCDRQILNPREIKISLDSKHKNCDLNLLGKYKNDILIRTSVHHDNDIYEILKHCLDLGCKRWEYYYLVSYDYSEEDVQKFRNQLTKIYELKDTFDFINCGFITNHDGCENIGQSLCIDVDGKVYICGYLLPYVTFNPYKDSHFSTIFEPFNYDKFLENTKQHKNSLTCYRQCQYKYCQHCFYNDCNIDKFRQVERDIYKLK